MEETYETIAQQTQSEYPDIVLDAQIHCTQSGTPTKLRIYITDGSYLDIWLSHTGKYAYHWERRHINGKHYRHDNAPHMKWSQIKTYPKHYHYENDENVIESTIPEDPLKATRKMLNFIRETIKD